MSERRACRLLGLDRSSCRYRPRPKRDDELCARLRELAALTTPQNGPPGLLEAPNWVDSAKFQYRK
jgi:hypothetical protein